MQTMIITFVSSMFAEVFSLGLYYPFDLIKTRMQVNQALYGYNGTLDAIIKVYSDNKYEKLRLNPHFIKILRLKNYYKGMFLYSLSFTTYVAL